MEATEGAGLGEIWEAFKERVSKSRNNLGHFPKNLQWATYQDRQKQEQPTVTIVVNQVDPALEQISTECDIHEPLTQKKVGM